MIESARFGPDALLLAATRGDGAAFRAQVDPHLRAIHLHCYRMLGSGRRQPRRCSCAPGNR